MARWNAGVLDPLQQEAHRTLGLEVQRLRDGVSEMRRSPASAMSSKPTTEMSPGTDSPTVSHASMSAMAPMSLEANRAVGAPGPLMACSSRT